MAFGFVVCLFWIFILGSLGKTITRKFVAVRAIEEQLPIRPYSVEYELYRGGQRGGQAQWERFTAGLFASAYLGLATVAGLALAAPTMFGF